MVDPIAAWHHDHVRFSRLLDLLERQLAAFHSDDHPDYDLMREIVHYLGHYSDRYHHPREDVAFARLAERDPALRLPVARLQQEHRVIALAGEKLLKFLDDIAAEAVVERSEVEAAAATYLVYYRHHVATEESDIMPLAARLMTPDDWAAVASAVPNGSDPLFGEAFEARYRELRRHIAQDAKPAG